MDIKELQEHIKEIHRNIGNHYKINDVHSRKYYQLAKLMEETGELSEAILKNDNLQRHEKHGTKEYDVPKELADVIIVIFSIAEELNIDVEEALKEKIKTIRSRDL